MMLLLQFASKESLIWQYFGEGSGSIKGLAEEAHQNNKNYNCTERGSTHH